jgi:uncharacterized delta-60 repeat protein
LPKWKEPPAIHIHPLARVVGATLAIGLTQVMLGSPALAVAGDLDPIFSGDGRMTTGFPGNADASGVAVQADGKIVAVGSVSDPTTHKSKFALARYRTDGTLDPIFSGDGRVTTAFPGGFAEANGVAIQQDGKIVAAGGEAQGFALARYNPDGTLDLTFGGDGKVTTGFATGAFANAVMVQADGKILAAGQANLASGEFRFALARYRPNGTLDLTFSGDGRVTTALPGGLAGASDLALQQDGKIVAAGSASDPTTFMPRFALARYRTDGALDPTFSGNGKVITAFPGDFAEAFGVALQQNGKIVAAGDTRPGSFDFQFALARYRPDGTLDPTFSGDGRATTAFAAGQSAGASDLGIQADGKIVAGGTVLLESLIEARFAVVRYRSDGTLDPTFSGDGKVTTAFAEGFAKASSLAIQADGKMVAAGRAGQRFALARYLGS